MGNQPDTSNSRERILKVLRFLAEVAKRRNPVVRDWSEHAWTLDLAEVPIHPAIKRAGEVDDPAVVLSVKRHKETACEPPPAELADWIQPGWATPENDVQVLEARNVESGGSTKTLAFEHDPRRVQAFTAWKQRRDRWVAAERPTKRVNALFQRLFELRGRLERESERIALVIADGMLLWKQPQGEVRHPLVSHRLELRFDPLVPRFDLCYTSDTHELNAPLLREFGVDGKALGLLHNKFAAAEWPLLDPKTNDLLAELMHRLFQGGELVDAAPTELPETPQAIRQAVVLLVPRSAGVINAIEALSDRLAEAEEIPGPLRSIVECETEPDDEPVERNGDGSSHSTGRSGHSDSDDHDLLLTKPSNPEQRAIVRALTKRGKVVVQGPPGTGKTHTIANLIGHLLAEGKSVLVTSYTTKALRVVRDKVAEDLQPLCVTLLDRDREGQELLSRSVRGIISGLQIPRSERDRVASGADQARRALIQQLGEMRRSLRTAVRDEYDDIVLSGRSFPPSSAARIVRDGQEAHAWLPGPIARTEPCPLSADEVREVYRLQLTVSAQDEASIRAGLPTEVDMLPPADVERELAALHDLDSRCADPRPEVWRPGDTQSLDELKAAREAAALVVRGVRKADSLILECMNCGRLGGSRREPWDDLLKSTTETAAEIDRLDADVVRFAPQLDSKIPRAVAMRLLDAILASIKPSKRLTWIKRLIRPHWWWFQKRALTRGAQPWSHEEFAALRALLERDRLRDELVRRWQAQIQAVEASRKISPGVRPEDTLRQYVSTLRDALDWSSVRITALERALDRLGVNWSLIRESVPLRTEACGELRRLADAIETVLMPTLEARINARNAEEIRTRISQRRGRLASGDATSIGRLLADALGRENLSDYRTAYARAKHLIALYPASQRRDELLTRLRPQAASWTQAIAERASDHSRGAPLSDPETAWTWRQLEQEIRRRSAIDINELQRRVAETESRLQAETSRYVSATVWAKQHRRTTGPVRSALLTWEQTVTSRGFETGVRSERLKAEARQLLNQAREAVPVWIMPITRLVESYDFKVAQFDVVILDEASQCDMLGLAALGIARSAIIVGDDKQVTPRAVGEDLSHTQTLIDEMLQDVPGKHLYTGRQSMYHLATAGFGQIVRLVEHFRCASDIIQFSNHLSYDGEMKPLRETGHVRTTPFVVEHRVGGGERGRNKLNETEAMEVVALIAAMSEQPEYDGKTFGVISLLGEEQSAWIENRLRERIGEAECAAREVLCGIPPHFQGDERDVVVLSVVDSPGEGPLRMRKDEDLQKWYNVAASRARDQLWVVHSLNPEIDLKDGDLRKRVIDHARDPTATERQVQVQGQRVESEFESQVLKRLTAAGYRVQTQWGVGAFRIDMVVLGADGKRAALECDGDRFHPPEDLDKDLERQQILERLGWRFVRVRGSEYFRDPDAAIARIRASLSQLGVEPIGAEADNDARPESSELHNRVLRRAAQLRQEWARSDFEADADTGSEAQEDADGQASETPWLARSIESQMSIEQACRAIVRAVRESKAPLGRAELLGRTGISPQIWTAAIRNILREGLLVMQGSKRGARYSLPADEHVESFVEVDESEARNVQDAPRALGPSFRNGARPNRQ